MGSGDWLKTILGKRTTKHNRSKQIRGSVSDHSNESKLKSKLEKSSNKLDKGSFCRNNLEDSGLINEEIAAIRIQNAFRGFQAKKILRQLKGMRKLSVLSNGGSHQRQISFTLQLVKSWSKIQTEIRNRRASMVSKGRIKLKKHESQVKLEAKLQDLEVEWSGGAETMEETLSKIYQREEAAVKRERAMAYALSHQWRANSSIFKGQPYEISNGNWGWSWTERWIAARPWEMRISGLQKAQSSAAAKCFKKGNPFISGAQSPIKPPVSTVRISTKKSSAQLAVNQELLSPDV